MVELFANSGDRDQTPQTAVSELSRHCVMYRVINYFKHQVYYVSINSFIYYVSKKNFLEQHDVYVLDSRLSYFLACHGKFRSFLTGTRK